MTTREENAEQALWMIDKLSHEIKRHERNSKLCVSLSTKLAEKDKANHKRELINKIRISFLDIEDGIKTLGEVMGGAP